MGNKLDRNDPCPCKSGLKLKKCHGDVVLVQIAKDVTQTVMALHIVERTLEAGLVEADDHIYLDGIRALADKLARLVPSNIEINVVVPEPPVPEIDLLKEKEEAGGDNLKDIQLTMVKCTTCGTMLPAGMDCAKPQCKKGRL